MKPVERKGLKVVKPVERKGLNVGLATLPPPTAVDWETVKDCGEHS